jgi:hypothetical protein
VKADVEKKLLPSMCCFFCGGWCQVTGNREGD